VLQICRPYGAWIGDEIIAVVPGTEGINVVRENLSGRMTLTLTETGIRQPFPSRLISDGTMYETCSEGCRDNAASHPNCPGAKYFVQKLGVLGRGGTV